MLSNIIPRKKSVINKCLKFQIIRWLGDLLSTGSPCGGTCPRLPVGGDWLGTIDLTMICIEYSTISNWTMQKRAGHLRLAG